MSNHLVKEDVEGAGMYQLMEKLFPICRSITGNGVRETLKRINEITEIDIHEVASGTEVFDWIIPKEWNIKDAYIKNKKGKRIVDFKKSNLHVLNYSIPINTKMRLSELKYHIITLPDQPDAIPYRTSYYDENWGFCMSHNEYMKLQDDEYEVCIDSTLANGSLTYGECFIQGETQKEFLLTCYICHPSMCNDNLSGTVLLTYLIKILKKMRLKYSYRFLFIPETIGAITWLARNQNNVKNIKYGLVATCVGDSGHLTYKKSRDGNNAIDKIAEYVLKRSGNDFEILDFFPTGSDERQFCSPGFNLPVGSLIRTPYARFPEYHTSKDDLTFVKKEFLTDTLEKYLQIILIVEKSRIIKGHKAILTDVSDRTIRKRIERLEKNEIYENTKPYCEPHLSKYNLYLKVGGNVDETEKLNDVAKLWILNFSDGTNYLLDIAEKSGIDFNIITYNAELLLSANLLKKK